MKKTAHKVVEMLIIRLNHHSHADRVGEIFKEVSEWFKASGYPFSSMTLCKSGQVENDWAVYLHRHAHVGEARGGKTEGLSFMFRSVGMIHHTVWRTFDSVEQDTQGTARNGRPGGDPHN